MNPLPFRLLAVLLLAAALAATARAATTQESSSPGPRTETDLAHEQQTALRDYRVAPMDTLSLSVYQEPDLTRDVRVSQTGAITVPLLGNVEVAGLRVSEVEEKITLLLKKDFIRNPQVLVSVKDYSSRRVFVLGEVRTPGPIEIPPEEALSLLQVIARVGGFTNLAATDHVRIRRTERGKVETFEVNATDLMKRGRINKDIDLRPGDVIVVPTRFF
ncbi:MAG: polysaccharide biosynthesis/export family protein [Verrucomicrobiia bacterium]